MRKSAGTDSPRNCSHSFLSLYLRRRSEIDFAPGSSAIELPEAVCSTMVPLLPRWPPEIKPTRFLSFRIEFNLIYRGKVPLCWSLPRLLFFGTDDVGST